jgi:hypothetical protein
MDEHTMMRMQMGTENEMETLRKRIVVLENIILHSSLEGRISNLEQSRIAVGLKLDAIILDSHQNHSNEPTILQILQYVKCSKCNQTMDRQGLTMHYLCWQNTVDPRF